MTVPTNECRGPLASDEDVGEGAGVRRRESGDEASVVVGGVGVVASSDRKRGIEKEDRGGHT